MLTLIALAFVIAFVLAFRKASKMREKPRRKNENILLVIAHPDDEAMFFVPAIKALRETNQLFCLCLSNGNFAGLGKIREKELEKSCSYLAFKEAPTVVDDPRLQDGMQQKWPAEVITEHINKFFKAHSSLEFQTILTFDSKGISSHPNHISTHFGCISAVKGTTKNLLFLQTFNIVRKYSSFVDILWQREEDECYTTFDPRDSVNSLACHYSQFVWFRKLFIGFSSYTFVNSLKAH